MKPHVVVVGQITVDDTVPVFPGQWNRQLGGNAFYSAAGARLWCEEGRVGMVARVPRDLPLDAHAMLSSAGLSTEGLIPCDEEALVEWILYEEDGNRQSMPRNLDLRDPAANQETLYLRYLKHIGNISATAEDIPPHWLPAKAIHLAPQVPERHHASCMYLKGMTNFLSIDPSPHYSRNASALELATILPEISALLPSQAEAQWLHNSCGGWEQAVACLQEYFPEAILKCGSAGSVVGHNRRILRLPPAESSPMDLTGAGDSFSGAYAANRTQGHDPYESAMRASVTAAMVIETSGIAAALRLQPAEAATRLEVYKKINADLLGEIG